MVQNPLKSGLIRLGLGAERPLFPQKRSFTKADLDSVRTSAFLSKADATYLEGKVKVASRIDVAGRNRASCHIKKWTFATRLQGLSTGDSGLGAVRVRLAKENIVRDCGHN